MPLVSDDLILPSDGAIVISDVNLYRDQANRLKTDDHFHCAGIASLGNVNPRTTNTYNLGEHFYRWKDLYMEGILKNGDGTALAPSYTFLSDNNTGIYQKNADELGFTAGGAVRAWIKNNGIQANNYYSSGGVAGATGEIKLATVNSITVKNGLITGWK